MSEKLKRILLTIIVLGYIISPVDFMPGFLGDDAIVAIIGYLINNRISKNKKELDEEDK